MIVSCRTEVRCTSKYNTKYAKRGHFHTLKQSNFFHAHDKTTKNKGMTASMICGASRRALSAAVEGVVFGFTPGFFDYLSKRSQRLTISPPSYLLS